MGGGDSKCEKPIYNGKNSEIQTNSNKNIVIQKMILRVQNKLENKEYLQQNNLLNQQQQQIYNTSQNNVNGQYPNQQQQMNQQMNQFQQNPNNNYNQQNGISQSQQQYNQQNGNYNQQMMSQQQQQQYNQQMQQQQQQIQQQQQQYQFSKQQSGGNNNNNNNNNRRIRVNCNIDEYLFSKLPSALLYRIVSFVMQDYQNIILVSPLWYCKLQDCVEEELLKIDNDFIKRYSNSFLFKNSYLTIKPIKVNNHFGFRMDRNICAEVLPTISDKSVTIQYTNKQFRREEKSNGQQRLKKYLCEFQIDVIPKKNQRVIWAYKEDCKHNYDKKKTAFVQPITPVKVGDHIKISVNFFNMNGLVNIYSIQWKDLKIEDIPSVPIYINPNQVDKYDKERICETEEIYSDWALFKYFHNINKKRIDDFVPYLFLKEVYCAGVDIITNKHIYIAKQSSNGILTRSKEKLGVKIQIVDNDEMQVCEIKRKGLYSDNESIIQLRIGDIFVFYISGGD